MMEQPPGKIKILYVEDNESDYELVLLQLSLSQLDYELTWVDSLKEFEVALQANAPDIVLCDHNLRDFSSQEAYSVYQKHQPNIPFILVTSTISEQEAVERLAMGIDDYILKDRLQRLPVAIARAIMFRNTEKQKQLFYRENLDREKRFRALVENSNDALVLCGKNLLITYSSPAAERLHGNRPLKGERLHTLWHKSDAPQMVRAVTQALLHPGKVTPFQVRVESETGETRWVEGSFQNLIEVEGVTAFVINYRDISKKKSVEADRARSEAIVSAIVNNSQISYVLLTPDFRVNTFNQQAGQLYQQEFSQMLKEGEYIFNYLPPDRREKMTSQYERALHGDKLQYELSLVQQDGSVNWYLVRVFPVFETTEKLMGIVIATENITARKIQELQKEELHQHLISHNKNLEQFSYIVSHNLRGPVARILGLANLLNGEIEAGGPDLDRCLTGLKDSANAIDQVIMDLNLILQTNREADAEREHVNLESLIREIEKALNVAEDIQHVISFDLKVQSICTVRSYLHSIFLNLVSNSIKYRRKDVRTEITISSTIDGDHVVLVFSDNGSGIDLEKHEDKLFGLYNRFHPHIEGRGMGLFMTRAQVELLGGKIGVKSKYKEGTSFTIVFPRKSTDPYKVTQQLFL